MRVSHWVMVIIHFIIDIGLDFTRLSDPTNLAITISEEGSVCAKIYVITSSKRCGQWYWQWGIIAKLSTPEKIETIDHNTLLVSTVSVARDITACAPFCMADKRDEVQTDEKHKPCMLIMWGWQQMSQKRSPQTSRWWQLQGQREKDVFEWSQWTEGGGGGGYGATGTSCPGCTKPATNHRQRNGRDVSSDWVSVRLWCWS